VNKYRIEIPYSCVEYGTVYADVYAEDEEEAEDLAQDYANRYNEDSEQQDTDDYNNNYDGMNIILDAEDISEADLPRDYNRRGDTNNSSTNLVAPASYFLEEINKV
jgi:hypothetical protein